MCNVDVRCLGTWGTLAVMFGPSTLHPLQPKALEKQNHPSPPLPLIPERNRSFELLYWLEGGVGRGGRS